MQYSWQNHLQRHPFLVEAVNQIGGIGHTYCSSRELVFKGSVEENNETLVDQCRVDEYMVKMPLTLTLSRSAHQQQEHNSTQRSTHTFTQCHIQVVDTLPVTSKCAKQRPHKIHTTLIFHLEARVWIFRDKHQFRGKHHQLCPLRYDPNTVRESI
jgi:hypothetical protein